MLLTREFALPERFRVSFDVRFLSNVSLLVGVGADSATNALDRPESRTITEQMLKDAVQQKPDNLIEMTLTRDGQTVTAQGTSRVAGILGMMFRANVFGINQGSHPVAALGENAALHVEFLVDRPARQYVILGDGQEMFRWRDPTPLEGAFLHFGLAPTENNASQPVSDAKQPKVELYNFRIDHWPGFMSEDHRTRFLTRRMGTSESSITHALRSKR